MQLISRRFEFGSALIGENTEKGGWESLMDFMHAGAGMNDGDDSCSVYFF